MGLQFRPPAAPKSRPHHGAIDGLAIRLVKRNRGVWFRPSCGFFHKPGYIAGMVSRVRSSCGRPRNAPAAFIQPCRPIVAKQPPSGEGWVHELKHDGYRLQIHVRDGRVKLYTMNGADWTKRYPRIVEEAARLREPLIIDAEVVCLDAEGVADFDALQSHDG